MDFKKGAKLQYDNALARDDLKETTLKGGTKLYRLDCVSIGEDGKEKYEGTWLFDEQEMEAGGFLQGTEWNEDSDGVNHETLYLDAERIGDRLQIPPVYYSEVKDKNGNNILDENGKEVKERHVAYKNHISVYEVPEDVEVKAETGIAEANPQWGHGGGRQIHFSDKEEYEKLVPVDDDIKYIVVNQDAVDRKVSRDMEIKAAHNSYMDKKYGSDPNETDVLDDEDIDDEDDDLESLKLKQSEKMNPQDTDDKRVRDR